MTTSADQDQLASSLDLDLHCLLRQGMSCSTREGLNKYNREKKSKKKKKKKKKKNVIVKPG